jgi:hypothetical protein
LTFLSALFFQIFDIYCLVVAKRTVNVQTSEGKRQSLVTRSLDGDGDEGHAEIKNLVHDDFMALNLTISVSARSGSDPDDSALLKAYLNCTSTYISLLTTTPSLSTLIGFNIHNPSTFFTLSLLAAERTEL